jgi:cytochrome c-type biogenesis protein CcmH
VKLVPALAAGAAPTDTVFVFARAAQGPRMPLAIVRKQVKDLPFTFTLDDSMAMNPAMKLSSFQQVVVGARVSKSGNAMPQSGDLQGQTDIVALNAGTPVEVIISSVVP